MDEVKMSEYQFHRVDKERYKDLVYISIKAFGIHTTVDFYKAKMDTEYLGVSHLGYLAYSESGEPAAFYGAYPCMMEYNGKAYLAAQSGDTMTNPSHGGKGLFTTLAKMTYSLAKEEGIQFIFGFPNSNSYPGFIKKLNWICPECMREYKLKIPTMPLAAIAIKMTFLLPVYNAYVRSIVKFYTRATNALPCSIINPEFGRVQRSEAFFKYKSFYDNHLIRLSGKSVWLKVEGSLQIGDIEIVDSNEIAKIIQKIKILAFFLGTHKIIFSVGKNTFWDIQLKGKIPCEDKTHVGFMEIQSGLPLEKFKYTAADFDTF
jgi:hypothetical protein